MVGGHNNYIFFLQSLMVEYKSSPTPRKNSDLDKLIIETFGTFDTFKKTFSAALDGLEDCSWVWLAYN